MATKPPTRYMLNIRCWLPASSGQRIIGQWQQFIMRSMQSSPKYVKPTTSLGNGQRPSAPRRPPWVHGNVFFVGMVVSNITWRPEMWRTWLPIWWIHGENLAWNQVWNVWYSNSILTDKKTINEILSMLSISIKYSIDNFGDWFIAPTGSPLKYAARDINQCVEPFTAEQRRLKGGPAVIP